MKHPKFYKRTIHRRPGFSPAKSLFPPICCRAEALPAPDTFSVSAIFSDGLLPVAAYRPAFPARTLRRENPLRPHPAAQPQKSRPKRAAGDLTVMAVGFRRQFARGGTRGAFFLRMRPVVFGGVRPVFVGTVAVRGGEGGGRGKGECGGGNQGGKAFCFMVPTPSVVGGKGRMIRAGGVLFRKAG